jgi:hypothetical protein
MKVILIVGPSQSGSTLLFNMVRILLEDEGHVVDSCWHSLYTRGEYDKRVDYLIVKCHFYEEALHKASDIVFLPLRDFRDSAVSCQKRYNNLNTPDEYIGFLLQNIGQFESWRPYATYIFKYESYMAQKQVVVVQIAAKLGIYKIHIHDLMHELDSLHKGMGCPETDLLPKTEYEQLLEIEHYRKTLMTKSHNTSGGQVGKHKTDIPKGTLIYIESNETIRKFLTSNCYRISAL